MTYPYPTLTPRIPLDDALVKIAEKYDFDLYALRRFATEDTIGGYHHDVGERTCERGIWGVEGQVVYALIRITRPKHILEVGNMWGTSMKHICEAVLKNKIGKVTSIDLHPRDVPEQYQTVYKTVMKDLFNYNYNSRPKHDFVFEDAFHTVGMTEHVWRGFMEYGKKGGFIISHDSEHCNVGVTVKEGIDRVTDDYLSVAIDPADCGLAIGRKA